VNLELTGRVAVVAAGTNGIGLGIARELAQVSAAREAGVRRSGSSRQSPRFGARPEMESGKTVRWESNSAGQKRRPCAGRRSFAGN